MAHYRILHRLDGAVHCAAVGNYRADHITDGITQLDGWRHKALATSEDTSEDRVIVVWPGTAEHSGTVSE